jgi:AcrR family transcriptional regulator
VAAVSIEALSARTGVSKPTIYRSWPNAQAVVMTALMDQLDARMSALPRGDPVAILRGQLRDIARVFAARSGRHVASMLASADPASELGRAFRNHFILARRQEGRAILERAVRDGHLRADLDLEVALDLLYAPIFYRLLLGHAPLDDAFGEAVVDHLITGLGGRKQPRRRGSSSR